MSKSNTVEIIFRSIFLLTLSFWIGSIFFFSTVAAQSIFTTLPREEAGKLITVIFDTYYPMQYIFAAIMGATGLYLFIGDGFTLNSVWLKRLVLITIMLLITLYSGIYIRNNAKEAKYLMNNTEITSERYIEAINNFKTSHRNSVIGNGLVFLLGIVILIHVSNKYNK